MSEAVYGRRFSPDDRDERYPLRMLLSRKPLPTYKYYDIGPKLPLNQAKTGTCVAHAAVGFLYAEPLQCPNPPDPFDFYRAIIATDEFTDNDVEVNLPNDQLQMGTSVRAGVKTLQAQGHIKSYTWAYKADEAALWLLTQGILIAGVNWYGRMTNLEGGYAIPKGELLGGHAFLIVGYDRLSRKAFLCLNSWGWNWGNHGFFWIRHKDMDKLLREQGELCAAIEQVVEPIDV